MTGLERGANFTVRLEAADPGTVSGARVDNDKRPFCLVDRDFCRRHDAHKGVIHRPRQTAAVDDELDLIVQHMRSSFRQMFAILIAPLAHDIPIQHAALGGVEEVVHCGAVRAPKIRNLCRAHLRLLESRETMAAL